MELDFMVGELSRLGYVWPDRSSVAITLGGEDAAKGARRCWSRLIGHAYARDALKTGFSIRGKGLTVDELEVISKDSEAWRDRVKESRGLAPLLAPRLAFCLRAPDNMQGLRNSAISKGLTPVAWRWLGKQPTGLTQKLFSTGLTPESVWWANIFASIGAHIDGKLLVPWLEPGRLYMGAQFYRLAAVNSDESAWVQTGLARLIRSLPTATIQNVSMYEQLIDFLRLKMVTAKGEAWIGVKANWNSLLRQVQAERAARVARFAQAAMETSLAEETDTSVNWPSCLQEKNLTLNGVEILEICSAAGLVQEGALMEHCVGKGAYVQECVNGKQAIFRLSEPYLGGFATLQLRKDSSQWRIAQLAGPQNRQVPQVFWRAAKALCLKLN